LQRIWDRKRIDREVGFLLAGNGYACTGRARAQRLIRTGRKIGEDNGSTGIRDRNQQKPFCHTPGQVTETETGLAEVTPHLAMIEHLGEGKG